MSSVCIRVRHVRPCQKPEIYQESHTYNMIFFQVQRRLSLQLYGLDVLLSGHCGIQTRSWEEWNLSLRLAEYVQTI